jgi:hypothetical protein
MCQGLSLNVLLGETILPLAELSYRPLLHPDSCHLGGGELHLLPRSRGSSVSIVSDYGLDVRAMGMIHGKGKRIFPLVCVSRPAFGVHPASHPMGTGGPFRGDKAWPGRGADHLPFI